MRKKVIILIFLFIFAFGLTGCNKDINETLVNDNEALKYEGEIKRNKESLGVRKDRSGEYQSEKIKIENEKELYGVMNEKNNDETIERYNDGSDKASLNVRNEEYNDEMVNQNMDLTNFRVNKSEIIDYSKHIVFIEDFEGGKSDFVARGGEKVHITSEEAYGGKHCLKSSNRMETWQGASVDLSQTLTEQKKYTIRAWVKYTGGTSSCLVYAKIEQNGENYLNFGSVMAKSGDWTLLEGSLEIPTGTSSAALYFETEYKLSANDSDLADIFIDEIELSEVLVLNNEEKLPSLFEIHEEYFRVGVALSSFELAAEDRVSLITSQFNSMTMGNDMKPENILDYITCRSDVEKYKKDPALDFTKLNVGMMFAKEHGISMRGHTLIWHSQTPRWFFTENYSKSAQAKLASREVMISRMESYIRQVLTYCQSNYPGIIYAFDVVNEAIEISDGEVGGYRSSTSLWYQIIGPEYVELAFFFAKKYAEPEIKLFYNDYNCYEKQKLFAIYDLTKKLVEKGILDGIGMQSHLKVDVPSIMDYEYAIRKYSELGVEIHITELDIDLDSNKADDLTKLATKYKKLFTLFRYMNRNGSSNITSVTLWGLSDETSWLNMNKRKYPLLFDDYLMAKDAYWGACLDVSIPSY